MSNFTPPPQSNAVGVVKKAIDVVATDSTGQPTAPAESVQLQAEAYDVAVDMSFPKGCGRLYCTVWPKLLSNYKRSYGRHCIMHNRYYRVLLYISS